MAMLNRVASIGHDLSLLRGKVEEIQLTFGEKMRLSNRKKLSSVSALLNLTDEKVTELLTSLVEQSSEE